MKCRSVACVWAAPPQHRVTAAVVFTDPPALYTGGSDGSIVWWSLVAGESKQVVRPMAMLCGHSAEIADLAFCLPVAVQGDDNHRSSFVRSPVYSDCYSSLLSASIDGVLCVWSRDSGYCRRRRNLPPWAGMPCIVSSLPMSPRYVCIACNSTDSPAYSSRSYAAWPLEDDGSNATDIERQAHHRRASKCKMLIVDSDTLTVVRTVSRGGLSIVSIASMAIFSNSADGGGDFVAIADVLGQVQSMDLRAEYHEEEEEKINEQNPSSSEIVSLITRDSPLEEATAAALSLRGTFLVLIYSTYFIVKSVPEGHIIEKIDLRNSSLCTQYPSHAHLSGCTFMHNNVCAGEEGCADIFAVWSINGAAIVFSANRSVSGFRLNHLFEIASSTHQFSENHYFHFCQYSKYLLRIESISFDVCGSQLYRPHMTIWEIPQYPHLHSDPEREAGSDLHLGEGFFPDDSENYMGSLTLNKRFVSSSMVLPEDFIAPLTVITGFFSGEIEAIKLGNLFSNRNPVDSPVSVHSFERSFLGHKGAVLCLAAHKMATSSNNHDALHVLISGGLDGTVRLWDLDTGCGILVLHHHTAPVRQIILPQSWTDHPWSDCILSIGEDGCVALASLDTLNVERMFPGHPFLPSLVAWDTVRGYVACLCRNLQLQPDTDDCLYIWDVKTGARDRILHGPASLSMFDHFCKGMTSAACTLFLSLNEDAKNPRSRKKDHLQSNGSLLDESRGVTSAFIYDVTGNSCREVSSETFNIDFKYPINCTCPFPGIMALEFDLYLLMSKELTTSQISQTGDDLVRANSSDQEVKKSVSGEGNPRQKWLGEFLLCFCLSLLHLWDIDHEVDKLLMDEMNLWKPAPFLASGILGSGGSLTLIFPGSDGSLKLWKHSAEFSAMRSLTIVSVAQRIICSSHSCSEAGSELAAFYARKIAEEVPDIKPPLLQLLASFWQDTCEPVRMAARSLFHCAAPRSIPETLSHDKSMPHPIHSDPPESKCLNTDEEHAKEDEESRIVQWLESFESHDWVSCVGGTAQDSMASQIIVSSALAVWYPSMLKPKVPELVAPRLVKLVMAMNERYSSTAAELLAEGMDATWHSHIGHDLPRLLGDVFFQVECLSSGSSSSGIQSIRETLVTVLLPSLAMADVAGFLSIIESQIWATSSDSAIHVVSLNTLIRVVRGSPKSLVPFIDKVVGYILHTMDHGNSVLRKNCLQRSMATLREISRAFPMVALNKRSSRLAVGDAIGDVTCATIRVYDVESVTKIKILDAGGLPGFPSLLPGGSSKVVAAVISALSFSPDGDGLVAFSEHGLTIRWWSLGIAWWEKLSRSSVPVQCAKLIFVPPWEGFSPSSTRSSIMASISGHHLKQARSTEPDDYQALLQNIDLSYQLTWIGGRKVALVRQGQELGCFQL